MLCFLQKHQFCVLCSLKSTQVQKRKKLDLSLTLNVYIFFQKHILKNFHCLTFISSKVKGGCNVIKKHHAHIFTPTDFREAFTSTGGCWDIRVNQRTHKTPGPSC